MLDYLILFAKHSEESTPTGKGMSMEWAIVIGALVIGLAITLSPPRRTNEIKKPKDE